MSVCVFRRFFQSVAGNSVWEKNWFLKPRYLPPFKQHKKGAVRHCRDEWRMQSEAISCSSLCIHISQQKQYIHPMLSLCWVSIACRRSAISHLRCFPVWNLTLSHCPFVVHSFVSHFRCFASPFRRFASPFRCFVVSHFRIFVVSHRLFAVSNALSLLSSVAFSLFCSFVVW